MRSPQCRAFGKDQNGFKTNKLLAKLRLIIKITTKVLKLLVFNKKSSQLLNQGDELMSKTEVWYDTLVNIGRRIQAGEMTSLALTKQMLERIRQLEPRLKAFVTVTTETALAQAALADKEIAAGDIRSVLHGVPIAVKDLCNSKGIVTTAGMDIHADRIPASDATVVKRLAESGAVLLGKLKLTEGAFSAHHPNVEPPRNPWNENHWAGVSSSGSGVATAAGMCFGSLGSDTGGSIRFPSASNGIVGLKPTWGRVSRAGVFPLADTLDHIGPMTRSVADAAAILGVIAGADDDDPTASSQPVPNYLSELSKDINGIRIGFDERYCSEFVAPKIYAAILTAIDTLSSLGAEIIPVSIPDVDKLEEGWMITCGAEVAIAHQDTYPAQADRYGHALKGIIDIGRAATAQQYAALEISRREFTGAFNALFGKIDLMICPSMPESAPEADPLGSAQEEGEPMRALRFTAPFNYSGSPTLSMPWGFDDSGLPLSVQFVGADFEEAMLLRVGHALEQAADWHTKHPPL